MNPLTRFWTRYLPMLKIVPSNQLKKDLRLAQKRGCKIEYLQDVVNTLAAGRKLDKKYRIIH